MKHLLFIDQFGGMGGGQRVLISMLRAALQTGHTVGVLAPCGALEATIAREFGNRVIFHPCEEPHLTHSRKGLSDILALLTYGWRFRRHLPLLRAQDYIHVNGLRHLPHLLLLSQGLKAKMVYHVHLGHSRLEKILLRMAARARNTFSVIVNSRFIGQTLGFTSPRIRLIENALDPAFSRRLFVDRFAANPPHAAAVIGTIRPEKGQDVAIAAVAQMRDLTLHIIGRDGDGAADWIAGLRDGVPVHVRFDGPVMDTAHAIDAAGIQFNLVPSRWDEPFGLVAIEGMACSCITIVSGRGGLMEIAERTGALLAPDTQSMRALLADLRAWPAAKLADLARRQHELTVTHYAPERFERQIRALVTEAADAAVAPEIAPGPGSGASHLRK